MKVSAHLLGPKMNRLESAYALCLEAMRQAGEVQWWDYEPLNFRLGRGAFFTPDFVLIDKAGEIHAHETKGYRREAAIVRIKTAAHLYRWCRFSLITRGREGWREEEIHP